MHRIGKIMFTLALVLPATPFVSLSQAQERAVINGVSVVGDCVQEFGLYENDDTHKAFAVSSNGRSCGYSYGYDSLDDAEDRAIEECATRGRGCRVIASW